MIWAQWRSWPCSPMRPQSLCTTSSTARATSFIWMRKQSREQAQPFLRKLSPSWTKVSQQIKSTWSWKPSYYSCIFNWNTKPTLRWLMWIIPVNQKGRFKYAFNLQVIYIFIQYEVHWKLKHITQLLSAPNISHQRCLTVLPLSEVKIRLFVKKLYILILDCMFLMARYSIYLFNFFYPLGINRYNAQPGDLFLCVLCEEKQKL